MITSLYPEGAFNKIKHSLHDQSPRKSRTIREITQHSKGFII